MKVSLNNLAFSRCLPKSLVTRILWGTSAFLLFVRPAFVFSQDKQVGLTIYNNNLALVKDVRELRLEEGVSEIKFQDVAAQIDPTSVYFSSLTAPEKVTILEQNYEYDLVNSQKILQKYVDQEINLKGKEGQSYSGTLLNASGGDIILQATDGSVKIVRMQTVQNMDFPSLPEGLITRPTLVWSLDCRQAGDHEVEVGYLTSGIQWHAEYIGVTNEDDTMLELSAWVSIDNKSGAAYEDARLKVVAGDVHRAREFEPYVRTAMAAQAERAEQFEEKAFFEYHLYTLKRPTTVANNQIKQISLFEPTAVNVSKKYIYDATKDTRRVRVTLEFDNKQEFGLGLPLPKGKVRIYKEDEDQALVFVGEDLIDHTPKDETVKVFVGNAFDIVTERIQKDRTRIGKDAWEETWEIKLRNHKDEPVEIKVVEHLHHNWEILRASHEYKKQTARTIEFELSIPKDKEVVLEYVVRYHR